MNLSGAWSHGFCLHIYFTDCHIRVSTPEIPFFNWSVEAVVLRSKVKVKGDV